MIKNYSNFNLKKYRLKEYESLSSRQYNTPIKSNFDLFNKRLKENFSFYNSPQNLDNEKMNRTKLFMNKSKIKIERYEKDLINQIKNENHNTRNKNNYFNQSDNSDNTNLSIYTPVDQYLYKNPFHSLTILKINNSSYFFKKFLKDNNLFLINNIVIQYIQILINYAKKDKN